VLCRPRYAAKKLASSGRPDDTCLHLRVAVRAEEDALRRLGPHSLERAGEAPVSKPKVLEVTIPMVELQGPDVPVVSAHAAAAARLLNQ